MIRTSDRENFIIDFGDKMEESFDKNKKRGSASTDCLIKLRKAKRFYDKIKSSLTEQAQEKIGTDFLKNYAVPDDFDFSSIDLPSLKRVQQRIFLPFSDETFRKFIEMEKVPVMQPYNANVRGRHNYTVLLAGKENGKCNIFSLNFSIGTQDNENFTDFSIKLDMLVSGKQWLQLARFDSIGAGHPNYFVDGKIASSAGKVDFAMTPHLHTNSEMTQVLFSECSEMGYMPAQHIPELLSLRNESNPEYFKRCTESFLEFAGVKYKINKKVSKDFHFDKKISLFDESSFAPEKTAAEFLGIENQSQRELV